MDELRNRDLLHMAMVQNHIQGLGHDEQIRIHNLAEQLRAVLCTESEHIMQAAHALVSAEMLLILDGGFVNE